MGTRRPSELFRERLRLVREQKGWKRQEVADRVAELVGAPMHQTAIAKLENGERKQVTLDEVLLLAVALDVSPLSLFLPPNEDDLVAVAPAAEPIVAQSVRAWITGTLALTALPCSTSEDKSGWNAIEWRTIDGKVLPDAEAKKRQRFYEREVSAGQWKVLQTPGLAYLRQQVEEYIRASTTDDPELAKTKRRALDHLAAEIERQRAALDAEEGN